MQLVPYGYCECECGQRTQIAKRNRPEKGWIKGQPKRFVHGHNRRHPERYEVRDCGYLTPCWVWLNTLDPAGYGTMHRDHKMLRAHRVYYERAKGPIPDDLPLDHLCRVRPCVNPDHLEPVTVAENTRRGLSAKITLATAREIHVRIADGEVQADIARSYGISQQVVCDIKKGRKWKDAA
jgi:hypothetical protein